MGGGAPLCHHGRVNPTLRQVAALAALLVAPALAVGGKPVPVIRIVDTPEARESPLPPLALALPRVEPPPPRLAAAERETVAMCLVLEAASQGDFGMRGVMAVIRNRAAGRPEFFAPTVLRPKQFSALNHFTAGRESRWRVLTRAQRDPMWETALAIVDDATRPDWHDPTGGATHYTRSVERTPWTRRLAKTVTIGAHSFYR